MHLDHKLSWATVASHFKLVRLNKAYTPTRTDIFSAKKDNQENDLGHFRRKFCAVLKEFSSTERQKHPPSVVTEKHDDELFSDDVLYCLERVYGLQPHETNSLKSNPLAKEYQSLQYWIKCGNEYGGDEPSYSTSNADLADALKGLIIIAAAAPEQTVRNEASSAVLRLALHPKVPLQSLDSLGWGHSFGINHIAAKTTECYLLLNVVDKLHEQGSKVGLLELRTFLRCAADSMSDDDFPTHKLPHDAFLRKCGLDNARAARHLYSTAEVGQEVTADAALPDLLGKFREDCQQYLKICFCMLYQYDMLRRIWYGDDAADEQWNIELKSTFYWWGASETPY
ncbi:hypothetical protein HJFPF1_07564 [Paramyrothecium foliicola]|nr:hypothetical protein HJFPF1_07564 [Paramyrothecium foliicola]